MHLAYKYRIYPNTAQQHMLAKCFGHVRFVWNKLVANFLAHGSEDYVEGLSEVELKAEYEFLLEVPAVALQQKRMDFVAFKKQYFSPGRKTQIGKPKFKKKGACRDSFRYPAQGVSYHEAITENTIRIPKVGRVKAKIDRAIPTDYRLLSFTVSRNKAGDYFVSVLAELSQEQHVAKYLPSTGKAVGIDLGLKDLVITSDGVKYNPPKQFSESQADLKTAQQHLARKQSGSNRRAKQKRKVARIYRDITNRRKDYLHKLSKGLVEENDEIYIEDLNVKGWMKLYGKAASDRSVGAFVSMIEYKGELYGKSVTKISRWFPSSKACNECGCVLPELGLDVREWTCPDCGHTHDRDINAAKNILSVGQASRRDPASTGTERTQDLT